MTVFAVSIAVAMVIGVSITFESMTLQYQKTLGTATGGFDIIVRPSDEFGVMDESMIDDVRKVDGVVDVAGRVSIEARVHTELKTRYAWITGVTLDDFAYHDASLTNVDGTKELGAWDIVIDSRFRALIGDTVEVKGFTFKVVGILSTGVFGGISPFGRTTYYCYVNYRTAQQLFGMTDQVSFIFVKVANPAVIPLVSERIRKELPDYAISETRREGKIASYIAGFQETLRVLSYVPLAICCIICFNTAYSNVVERRHEIGVLQSLGAGQLQIFSLFFYESLFIGLVGATVGLVLSGLIAYLFLENLSAVLMLGRSGLVGPDLDTAFSGFGIGLASPILGGMIPAISAGFSRIVSNLNPRAGGRPSRIRIIAFALIGSILVYLGLEVTPELAFYSLEGFDIFSAALVASGIILVAASLLGPLSLVLRIFILPIVKNLSVIPTRNLTRSRTRSVLAFSLIAICLSFSVLVQGLQGAASTGVEKTVRRFFTADAVVSSDDGIPLKYLDELKRVSNGEMIEGLAPAMFITLTMYSKGQSSNVWREIEHQTRIMGIDPRSFLPMINVTLVEGSHRTPEDILLGNRNCLLTRSLAEKLDVKVGNRLAINITEEVLIDEVWVEVVSLHKINVAGIISDLDLPYLWIGGRPLDEVLMISYDSLTDLFRFSVDSVDTDFTNFLLVDVKPRYESNLDDVKRVLLERYESRWGLQVFTREDMAAQMKKNIDGIISVFGICIYFSLAIAALGVMNLVLTSTVERRWEIFLLRALGSSKLQIALCFISEALAIGWMGFASGVCMGFAFWRFFDMPLIGSQFTSAPPITSALLSNSLLVATLTTVAGTLYPAYVATQVPSLERRKKFEKVFIGGVKGVEISEALKGTLRHFNSSQSSSEVINFRVPDALARNVALTFLTFLPERGNLIETSTWDAELNVHKLVNCVLILRFDHALPLRHIPKTLVETPNSSRRIVLILESTFHNLAKESQELIPWFIEPKVEGKPVLTSLLEASDPNRDQHYSTTN